MTNGFPFVSMIPVSSKKCRREHYIYPLFLAPLPRHAVQLCFLNTPTCRQGRVMRYPGDRMLPKASHPRRALSFCLLFYLNPHEYFTSYPLSLFQYINNDHIYSTLNHFTFPQKSWVNLMLPDDHCLSHDFESDLRSPSWLTLTSMRVRNCYLFLSMSSVSSRVLGIELIWVSVCLGWMYTWVTH